MPKGPKGEKRPADVIGNAVKVMRIATGEITEQLPETSAAAELGRIGGKKGGRARAEKLTPERRVEIARQAARTRYAKRHRSDGT
jgi:hypothetical protein